MSIIITKLGIFHTDIFIHSAKKSGGTHSKDYACTTWAPHRKKKKGENLTTSVRDEKRSGKGEREEAEIQVKR